MNIAGGNMDGNWKLLADDTIATELFDLNHDHRELYNLLETYPEKGKLLLTDLKKQISEPRSGRGDFQVEQQVTK